MPVRPPCWLAIATNGTFCRSSRGPRKRPLAVMCAERCLGCLEELEVNKVGDAILETIVQYGDTGHTEKSQVPVQSPLLFTIVDEIDGLP